MSPRQPEISIGQDKQSWTAGNTVLTRQKLTAWFHVQSVQHLSPVDRWVNIHQNACRNASFTYATVQLDGGDRSIGVAPASLVTDWRATLRCSRDRGLLESFAKKGAGGSACW